MKQNNCLNYQYLYLVKLRIYIMISFRENNFSNKVESEF